MRGIAFSLILTLVATVAAAQPAQEAAPAGKSIVSAADIAALIVKAETDPQGHTPSRMGAITQTISLTQIHVPRPLPAKP